MKKILFLFVAALCFGSWATAGDLTFEKVGDFAWVNKGAIVAIDIHGDGYQSVLYMERADDKRSVYLENNKGTLTKYEYGKEEGLKDLGIAFHENPGMVVMDVNKDGKQDVVVAGGWPPAVNVYLNNGEGGFTKDDKQTNLIGARDYDNSDYLAAGDYDNDGWEDLFVLGLTTEAQELKLSIYRNNNGVFELANQALEGCRGGSIAVGDVNGDGNLDVFYNGYGNGYVTNLYYGDGKGTWTKAEGIDFVKSNKGDVAIIDFNGDGKMDLLEQSREVQNTTIYCNNGDGTFTKKSNEETGLPKRDDLLISYGDFNVDGKMDIIASHWSITATGGCTALFLNNGDFTFTKVDLENEARDGGVFAWDYDNDKKCDYMVWNYSDSKSWNAPIVRNTTVIEEPTPEPEHTYTVAGSSATVFGTAWNANDTVNNMTKQEDGTYKLEKTELTLAAGTIEFKVVEDHNWDIAYPADNYKLNIAEDGIYTITITFNPADKAVAATTTKTGDAGKIIPVIAMHGNFLGSWADTENFTLAADEATATLTLTIAEGNYEFGVRIDGTWTSNGVEFTRENASAEIVAGSGNLKLAADVAGEYTFTWTYATNTLTVTYPVVGEPVYEIYEVEIKDLAIDLDNLALIGSANGQFQVAVNLFLGEYNRNEDTYQLLPESYVEINGSEATFVEGYASVNTFDQTATAVVRCVWNGMNIELHLTMSAAPLEATKVVVENATVEIEKYLIVGDMYDYALKMTGEWINPEDGLTYPVLVEVPVYYPESTEPSEITSTVTVGGWGDNDPWLGFGEGTLTITTVGDVVTATGVVQNPMAGIAIDITISGSITPTGLEDATVTVKSVKMIKNGQLIINQNGREFNVQGAQL